MKGPSNISSLIIGVLIIISLTAFTACDNEEEERMKKEWIENEVKNLILNYRAEKLKACKQEIFEAAEYAVDSILSRMDLFDDLVDENIPLKPVKPEFVPLDSSAMENHKVERILKRKQ